MRGVKDAPIANLLLYSVGELVHTKVMVLIEGNVSDVMITSLTSRRFRMSVTIRAHTVIFKMIVRFAENVQQPGHYRRSMNGLPPAG